MGATSCACACGAARFAVRREASWMRAVADPGSAVETSARRTSRRPPRRRELERAVRGYNGAGSALGGVHVGASQRPGGRTGTDDRSTGSGATAARALGSLGEGAPSPVWSSRASVMRDESARSVGRTAQVTRRRAGTKAAGHLPFRRPAVA